MTAPAKTIYATKIHMKIVRILTEHDKLDVFSIAILANNNVQYCQKLLDQFEASGYVARLDHGQYTATR